MGMFDTEENISDIFIQEDAKRNAKYKSETSKPSDEQNIWRMAGYALDKYNERKNPRVKQEKARKEIMAGVKFDDLGSLQSARQKARDAGDTDLQTKLLAYEQALPKAKPITNYETEVKDIGNKTFQITTPYVDGVAGKPEHLDVTGTSKANTKKLTPVTLPNGQGDKIFSNGDGTFDLGDGKDRSMGDLKAMGISFVEKESKLQSFFDSNGEPQDALIDNGNISVGGNTYPMTPEGLQQLKADGFSSKDPTVKPKIVSYRDGNKWYTKEHVRGDDGKMVWKNIGVSDQFNPADSGAGYSTDQISAWRAIKGKYDTSAKNREVPMRVAASRQISNLLRNETNLSAKAIPVILADLFGSSTRAQAEITRMSAFGGIDDRISTRLSEFVTGKSADNQRDELSRFLYYYKRNVLNPELDQLKGEFSSIIEKTGLEENEIVYQKEDLKNYHQFSPSEIRGLLEEGGVTDSASMAKFMRSLNPEDAFMIKERMRILKGAK